MDKKIGILTYHRAQNYGALLQAFALQRAVTQEGGNCEIIDYICDKIERDYALPSWKDGRSLSGRLRMLLTGRWQKRSREGFERFRAEMLRQSGPCRMQDIAAVAHDYQILIAGGDQVFNPRGSGWDDAYFLNIDGASAEKYAYAASFGVFLRDECQDPLDDIRECLAKFTALGLRETTAARIMMRMLPAVPVETVLDPVLLLTPEEYRALESDCGQTPGYLLLYAFELTGQMQDTARRISRETGKRILYITNGVRPIRKLHPMRGVGPREFLWLMSHAGGLLTDSFHGAAFAVLFGIPFLTAVKEDDERIPDLLDRLNLKDARLSDAHPSLCDPRNPETIRLLMLERERSRRFLRGLICHEDQ
ncbi:polysaccharide pyruvyl transferase family protein [Candidatus Soleaferrea massiliensis]|uniref:polysaccharide pyruvyl transferase family protein n=1 Tax=Candidatus Soleaferrea massiliensis TaxID=1470354 RepID=UPI00058DC1F3|nr:polysaccharide pyruvyl transferase family protein [Candidatus Soleaferrea massiliensis]